MDELDAIAEHCNYTGYFEKHVTYPPKGLLPLPGTSVFADRGCDVWDMIFEAALTVNPAFDIYRIFDTYPILWDVLGFPLVSDIHFVDHSHLINLSQWFIRSNSIATSLLRQNRRQTSNSCT